MKRLLIALAISGLVAIAGAAYATEDGINYSNEPSGPGGYSPADFTLIEAWNDNGQPGHGGTYVSPCFAFQYVPTQSYVLERIEWYAGNLGGTVSTTVRNGGLNGPDLTTTGNYSEVPPRDWQGANLVPPIPVTAGSTYGIIYRVVVGAQISAATTGNIINHWHDPTGACSAFNGPFASVAWRARFYGTAATPVEQGTWGSIKNLYHY
jgi:hypothetical protein